MLSFDTHNRIVRNDPGIPNAKKKRDKTRKANKRAKAQRRKNR